MKCYNMKLLISPLTYVVRPCSGGSGISQWANHIIWHNFCWKLHENENFGLRRRRARIPRALDLPLPWSVHCAQKSTKKLGMLTRRWSHLPQLISSLTYAVYPWSVHCERASARCRNSDRVNVILFVVSNSKCHVIHKFPRICEWRVVDNVLFMTLLTTLLTTLSTAVLMTVTIVYNDIINDIRTALPDGLLFCHCIVIWDVGG